MLIIVIIVVIAIILFIVLGKRSGKPQSAFDFNNSNIHRNRKEYVLKQGIFEVTGYNHLSDEIKEIVNSEVGYKDQVDLIAAPNNKFDPTAIKVFYNSRQIGWVAKSYAKKKTLFDTLMLGGKINAKVKLKDVQKGYRRVKVEYSIVRD
ncbi:hypothetical protein QQ020_01595 [Fulvivirgaceae bacterium BMA12]|uniref:HIRAN domain-containing protein n=1 Tax=Agaribacillus aureus TaxID=3051825 RepID=A0ABT8KZ13_9BACT|nr:hypothetical protein [Fulvivirgaceae bacterium BMA12]